MNSSNLRFGRVLLKLSGEALGGQSQYSIDHQLVDEIAKEILDVHEMGVQVAVVVGGGNIFRGAAAAESGMERTNADYMGMLATVINALALQHALEKVNLETRVHIS